MWTYDSRLIAEEAWLEEWAEIQTDQESLRLWELAQAEAAKVDNEVLAELAAGNQELF